MLQILKNNFKTSEENEEQNVMWVVFRLIIEITF